MCSENHRMLFLDLYIALLFKYKEKDVIIALVSIDPIVPFPLSIVLDGM